MLPGKALNPKKELLGETADPFSLDPAFSCSKVRALYVCVQTLPYTLRFGAVSPHTFFFGVPHRTLCARYFAAF